jgi:hypothetical protein
MIEEPVVAVHIPPALRLFTAGRDELMASGDTVQDVLESADHEHPGLLAHLVSANGEIEPSLEVWLGGNKVESLNGLATPIGLEERVSIVPAA